MPLPPLSPKQREYVRLQWSLLRQANAKASRFSREWNARSAELEDKAERAGWDKYRLRTEKNDDLELKDLFAAWDFWQREARRIHSAISGELMCMQLLGSEPVDIFAGRADVRSSLTDS